MVTRFVFIEKGKTVNSQDLFNEPKPFIPRKKDEVLVLNECYLVDRVIHKFNPQNHTVFFMVSKSKTSSPEEKKIFSSNR